MVIVKPDKDFDLPAAELHLLDGAGHWLLETHFDMALSHVRNFLGRVHG